MKKTDSSTITETPRFTPTDLQPKLIDPSPLEIIRKAQETIEAEKEKLKAQRADYVLRIREIDAILGTAADEVVTRTSVARRGRRSAGGSVKDIIVTFLADGKEKKAKDIVAAVVKAGKSKVIGAALAGLVKAKAITNPSRGVYKIK